MKLQSIVVVILRLMTIAFILKAFLIMIPYMDQLFRIILLKGYRTFFSQLWLFFPWLSIFTFTLCAIVLWVFALPVACFLTRRDGPDLVKVNLTLADCYTFAFVVFGVFCIVDNLAGVINSLWRLFDIVSQSWTYWRGRFDFSRMLQAFIPFISGIILLMKSRSWALALAERQEKDEDAGKTAD